MVMKHLHRRRTHSDVAVTAVALDAPARGLGRLAVAIALAVAILATVFATRAIAAESEDLRIAKALSNAYAEVVEKVAPAVVGIETEKVVKISRRGFPGGGDPFELFEELFDMPREGLRRRPTPRQDEEETRRSPGAGTGIVIDKEGHILTNYHVISDVDTIKVEFAHGNGGKIYKAEVIGRDPNSDLAVIKLLDPPADLPVANLGDSDALKPGNIILAIGSPFGYKQSVSTGIISAKDRTLGALAYERFIQTDAAINPGNSGGPMVNLDGEVVGINAIITSRGGGSVGVGFAIPINQAKDVLKQLIDKGHVTRGWLGILMNADDPEVSRAMGHDGTGVVIAGTDPAGPAAKSGLRVGDLIVSFDGQAIKNNEHLRYMVAELVPEREVPVVIIRDGEKMDIAVNIEAQPEDLFAASRQITGGSGSDSMDGGQAEVNSSLGLTVRNLDKETRERYRVSDNIVTGVVITKVDEDSEAREKGIRAGMIITEMDKTPVTDVASFRQVMKDTAGKEQILIYVQSGDRGTFKTLNLK